MQAGFGESVFDLLLLRFRDQAAHEVRGVSFFHSVALCHVSYSRTVSDCMLSPCYRLFHTENDMT